MAKDDDVIYVDVVPRLDENETEKAGKDLSEKLKKGTQGAGREIGKQVNAEIDQEIENNGEKPARRIKEKLKSGMRGAGKDASDVLADELDKNAEDVGKKTGEKLGKAFGSQAEDLLKGKFGEIFDDLKNRVNDKDITGGLGKISGEIGKIAAEATGMQPVVDKFVEMKGAAEMLEGVFGTLEATSPALAARLSLLIPPLATIAGFIALIKPAEKALKDMGLDSPFMDLSLPDQLLRVPRMLGGNIMHPERIPDDFGNKGDYHYDEKGNWVPRDTSGMVGNDVPYPSNFMGPIPAGARRAKPGEYGEAPDYRKLPYADADINHNSFYKDWYMGGNKSQNLLDSTAGSGPSSSPADPKDRKTVDNGPVVIDQPTIKEPKITGGSGGNGLYGSGRGPVHVIVDGFSSGASGGMASFGGAGLSLPSLSGPLPDAHGAHTQLQYALQAAQSMFPGMKVIAGSYDHLKDKGFHPSGQAIDIAEPRGPKGDADMNELSNFLLQFSPDIEELIHQGSGVTQNIKSGKRVPAIDMPGSAYTTAQAGTHDDHVHLAIKDDMAQNFIGDLTGMSAGAAGGGRRGGMSQGYSGGMPGAGASIFGGGYVPGIVSPPTMPNLGGPTATGPKQQQPFGSGQGAGISGGGIIGGIEQGAVAAATAAGMMGAGGPAAGMAAQAGMQIMNQAIATGTQAASIAASIPLETFGLRGGQMGAGSVQLGGWGGKFLQGLIGQQANSANIAGGTQAPKKPEDNDPLNGSTNPQTPSGPSGAKDDPIHVKSADGPAQPPQGSATSAMNATGQMSAMPA